MQSDKQAPTLLLLTPGFPESEEESVMIPTKQVFIDELNKNFPEVNIIVLSFRMPVATAVYQWHGNTVIPFGKSKQGKIATFLKWLDVWKTLNQLRRKNKIIGIISFWCGECALVGRYYGMYHNIKHVCWISGQDARETNKLVKLIRPKSDELVAMSNFLVDEFYKNHKIRPGHLIPNGINPERFGQSHAVKDIDILAAGSLSRLKRYDIFVEVIKELSDDIPGLRVILCGSGEEDERIKSLVEQNGLKHILSLPGTTKHKETLRLMQRAKVFLHTSSYEGFGAVCIEALYAGAYVISFCKPMNQQIKNWYIVENKEEMVQKAFEVLSDPNLKHEPQTPYLMKDSASAFMDLLGYRKAG